MTLPKELPRAPHGVTQRLVLDDGTMRMSTIHMPDGAQLPITYQYKVDQRHDHGFRGYLIAGSTVVHEHWRSLVLAWPVYVDQIALLVAQGANENDAIASFKGAV